MFNSLQNKEVNKRYLHNVTRNNALALSRYLPPFREVADNGVTEGGL